MSVPRRCDTDKFSIGRLDAYVGVSNFDSCGWGANVTRRDDAYGALACPMCGFGGSSLMLGARGLTGNVNRNSGSMVADRTFDCVRERLAASAIVVVDDRRTFGLVPSTQRRIEPLRKTCRANATAFPSGHGSSD